MTRNQPCVFTHAQYLDFCENVLIMSSFCLFCCQPLDSSRLSSSSFFPLSFFMSSSLSILSVCLFSKSVSQQQVQAATPQPSPGSPLVPAIAQPAPPGTSQQVRQLQKQLRQPVNTSKLIQPPFSHHISLMPKTSKDKIQKQLHPIFVLIQ